jgi:energy-converting hydrogenase Eha subunit F
MNADQTSGYGYMIVRVSTARGAIPLEDATVTVYNYDPEFENGRGNIIAVQHSGAGGLTEKIALPAPPRSQSLSPGAVKPYETYNLSVTKEGYLRQTYVNVPIFEGITAIQNAYMIPLPENGQTDRSTLEGETFFETERGGLEPTSEREEE